MHLQDHLNLRLSTHLDALLAAHGDTYAYVKDYVMQGGKQLRPLIFLESVEAWGGVITDDVVDIACALELLHAFFLVHDDIMDGDEVRRNKFTLHTHFLQGGMQDGIGRAVVWGDILYTEVFRLLLAYPDASVANELGRVLASITATTAEGQILEASRSHFPTQEQLLRFYEKKTALYSLLLPLRAAALVSGTSVPSKVLDALATNAGIAYQVYDDYIEVIGEKLRRIEDKRCGDIMRLKATPLLLRVLQDLSPEDAQMVQTKFASGEELSLEEEQRIVSAMHEGQTLDEARALFGHHGEVAMQYLHQAELASAPTLHRFLEHYIRSSASSIARV